MTKFGCCQRLKFNFISLDIKRKFKLDSDYAKAENKYLMLWTKAKYAIYYQGIQLNKLSLSEAYKYESKFEYLRIPDYGNANIYRFSI